LGRAALSITTQPGALARGPDKRHQAVTDGLWQVKPALASSRPLAGRSTGAWATTRSIPGLARALYHQVTRRTGGIARTQHEGTTG